MYAFKSIFERDELSEVKGQKIMHNKKGEYKMIENIENIWDSRDKVKGLMKV